MWERARAVEIRIRIRAKLIARPAREWGPRDAVPRAHESRAGWEDATWRRTSGPPVRVLCVSCDPLWMRWAVGAVGWLARNLADFITQLINVKPILWFILLLLKFGVFNMQILWMWLRKKGKKDDKLD